MDWQTRMTQAIDYLERNLRGTVDYCAAAAAANCSAHHFMRMFEVITAQGPAEYVRRRRLSCAALELVSGTERIIDIAVRYGYDSPDSFTRAFKREFDCLPSEARIPGTRLHTFPPLSFSIALKGDKAMEYRIETGPALAMTGISMRIGTKDGCNFTEVPAFWRSVMQDGRCDALAKKLGGSKLGICGVSRDHDMESGEFTYSIAIERPADRAGLPEGCTDFEVPASTWAKFTSRGPLGANFQDTIKRVYSEWFPDSGKEHAGSAELEYYPPLPDTEAADYWCEYWVPIK